MEPVVIKWNSGNFSNGIRRNDTVYVIGSSIIGTPEEEILNTGMEKKMNIQVFGESYSVQCFASVSCQQPIQLRSALSSLVPTGALHFDSDNGRDLNRVLNRLSTILCVEGLDLKGISPRKAFALRRTSIRLGDPIKVLGLPFNNEWSSLFKLMLWKGNVCGALTADLLVIDSRGLPGIEGSLVLDADNRACGISLVTLDTRSSGSSGLLLAVHPTILWRPESIRSPLSSAKSKSFPAWLEAAASITVFVSHCGAWGTGIVLEGRYVVTCAHVVHFNKSQLPAVLLNGTSLRLRRCLLVAEANAVFDIAIYELRRPISKKASISEAVIAGDDCFVLGYGVFPSSVCSTPMVTQGGITNVNCSDNRILMIQTDCIVNSGCSGAGVFLKSNGSLVALMVYNLSDDSVVLPNANFCIPITYISHALSEFSMNKNSGVLHGLGRMPPTFRKVWIEAFSPVPKSKL